MNTINTTVIEETSKKLKLQIIVSAVLFWGGIIALFAAMNGQPHAWSPMIQVMMSSIGIVWYVVTKARIWWNHK